MPHARALLSAAKAACIYVYVSVACDERAVSWHQQLARFGGIFFAGFLFLSPEKTMEMRQTNLFVKY